MWFLTLLSLGWCAWLALALPSRAAESGTAIELLNTADLAFSSGDFAKADTVFSQFLTDYGKSAEAKTAVEKVYPKLALARIRTGKWESALETINTYLQMYPEGSQVEELSFFQGICQLQEQEYKSAADTLRAFTEKYPNNSKRLEAELAIGTALLAADDFSAAATHFAGIAKQTQGAIAGRCRTFELFARLELHDLAASQDTAKALYPLLTDSDSLALAHLLLLRLGDELLAADHLRDGLATLQRVWPQARLLQRQEGRVTALKKEAELARAQNDTAAALRLEQTLAQIEKEIGQLRQIKDYDTSLQFRIAQAFYELERFREASLLLSEMVKRLPESPLLEQAFLLRTVCFAGQERWADLVTTAIDFRKRYPESKSFAQVGLMQAEAHQKLKDAASAATVLAEIVQMPGDSPLKERALFLLGYNQLVLDQNDEAVKSLDEYLRKYPRGSLAESAVYWRAMAFSFGKKFDECRAAFDGYLKAYPNGQFKEEALFRRGHSLYSQQKFTEAYKELFSFIQAFPQSPRNDEARVLLGDSYFALGELDRGIAAFKGVKPNTPRFFEYSYFQINKAYRLSERFADMKAHNEAFIKNYPESTRVPEALNNIAFVLRQDGKESEARDLYWSAITQHGNNPDKIATEDLISGVAKLYKGPDNKIQLLAKLRDLTDDAKAAKKLTLASRLLWAQSQVLKKQDPEASRKALLEAGTLVPPDLSSPRVLADAADAFREAGQPEDAVKLYTGLRQYFPRSPLRDRAYAGLGLIAAAQGKEKEALDAFTKFEQTSAQSILLPQVLKAKAEILTARRDYPGAIAELEKLLASPAARGLPSVDALTKIGETYLAQNKPDKAVPYFQRIYVLYGKYSTQVAKAYWQSGQAFEKLNLRTEAVNTYKEFIGKPHLAQTEEYTKAKARLTALGEAS